jgi:hypothetical protein
VQVSIAVSVDLNDARQRKLELHFNRQNGTPAHSWIWVYCFSDTSSSACADGSHPMADVAQATSPACATEQGTSSRSTAWKDFEGTRS